MKRPRKRASSVAVIDIGSNSVRLVVYQSLSRSLTAEYLAQKPFVPLPVLGVPGWWAANAAPDFYDDPKVFRPRP